MSLLERLQSKHQSEQSPQLEVNVPIDKQANKEETVKTITAVSPKPKKTESSKEYRELKNLIYKYILREKKEEDVENIVSDLDSIITEILHENEGLKTVKDWKALKEEIKNDLTGYGPITPLLNDENVTEVMVKDRKSVV